MGIQLYGYHKPWSCLFLRGTWCLFGAQFKVGASAESATAGMLGAGGWSKKSAHSRSGSRCYDQSTYKIKHQETHGAAPLGY